jgi:ATPase subunit of ABC transporter with duplicated ATPase domains
LESLRVEKEYRLGIELTGEVSTRNALFRLPPGALPLGESRHLVFPELVMIAQDRIALTGPNGSGKSTLLRHIISQLTLPEERVICLPQELEPAVARQSLAELRQLSGPRLGEVMAYISRLGSRPDSLLDSENPSPGELRKILLALGITRRPHLIIMDEPTNHLDLPSIECLENALDATVCGLLLVAHDERFLGHLVNRRWIIASQLDRRAPGFHLRIAVTHGGE